MSQKQIYMLKYEAMCQVNPDSKVHGANMGPTWVLLAPGGPRVGPMNFAIGEVNGIILEW